RVLTPKPLPDLAPEAPVIGDSSQPLPVPSSTGGQETVREPQPGGIRHNPICEEGLFKQVLRALWDKTKQHSIEEIAQIDVKITDPTDGFRFLGGIGNIALVPQKTLKMVVDYATEKGRFSVEYEGEAAEASVFKEFLEPQLRIAKESNFEMIFSLRFEPSFSLRDEENRVKLSDQLTRFISAAQVFVTIFPSS
ncbi:MAG: hypothetical protein J6U18_03955, partial [Acetobacter sp.]|nr:hypothetical protein [Acetobacter sp.]